MLERDVERGKRVVCTEVQRGGVRERILSVTCYVCGAQ